LDLFVDNCGDCFWWRQWCFVCEKKGGGIGWVFEVLFGGNSTDVEGCGIARVLIEVVCLDLGEASSHNVL
jgi:hypothetical protein